MRESRKRKASYPTALDTLQKALNKTVRNIPVVALTPMIRTKLLDKGIKITSRRAASIARRLLRGKTTFSIPEGGEARLVLEFTLEDAAVIDKKIERFLAADWEGILESVQASAAPLILNTLKKRWPAEHRRQAKELGEFRKRLHGRWGKAIGKLRMLAAMARELGENINRSSRGASGVAGSAVVDVITRLHVRACQVTEEVIVLLESGFADGAMARWRTLHEISVMADFISAHGADCAQRYADHQIVESHKAASEYAEIREKLGYQAIEESKINDIQQRFDALVARHGRVYAGQYGWAAADLNGKSATFRDIEKSVGQDHFRGHYRMASHPVHANPKGIFFSMASPFRKGALLAGPSNAGLADAGHGAGVALTKMSATLVLLEPNFDHQIALRIMDLLSGEIGTSFLKAHEKLRRDEIRVTRSQTSN